MVANVQKLGSPTFFGLSVQTPHVHQSDWFEEGAMHPNPIHVDPSFGEDKGDGLMQSDASHGTSPLEGAGAGV